MTLFGFASFELALAVLVVTLTLALEVFALCDAGAPTLPREALTAACAALLVLAHGYAYAVLVLLVGVAALAAGERRQGRRLRMLAPSAVLAVTTAWAAREIGPSAGVSTSPSAPLLHFQGALDKLSLLFTPTLLTRTGADAAICVLLWTAVAAANWTSLRASRAASAAQAPSLRHGRAVRAGALALLVAFAVLPHEIRWFGFVDGRLVPIVLLLLIMAYRDDALSPRRRRFVIGVAAGAPVAMTAIALAATQAFQGEARGYEDVLGHVPAESRLLSCRSTPTAECSPLTRSFTTTSSSWSSDRWS